MSVLCPDDDDDDEVIMVTARVVQYKTRKQPLKQATF